MHEIAGQVHWHEPSGFRRAGFGKFNRPKTPYDLFMESDDIPIYRDIGVSKVQNLPLAAWPRMAACGRRIVSSSSSTIRCWRAKFNIATGCIICRCSAEVTGGRKGTTSCR
jgi:hypothetical protein